MTPTDILEAPPQQGPGQQGPETAEQQYERIRRERAAKQTGETAEQQFARIRAERAARPSGYAAGQVPDTAIDRLAREQQEMDRPPALPHVVPPQLQVPPPVQFSQTPVPPPAPPPTFGNVLTAAAGGAVPSAPLPKPPVAPVAPSLVAPAEMTRVGAPPPNPASRQLTGPLKVASDVFGIGAGMLEHPAGTMVGMAAAPVLSIDTLLRYGMQKLAEQGGPEGAAIWAGRGDPVTGEEAAWAAAQLAALRAAGPIENTLRGQFAKALRARMLAKGVASTVGPDRAAAVIARALATAPVGTAYAPGAPVAGGIVGALAGGTMAAGTGARVSAGKSPYSIEGVLDYFGRRPEVPPAAPAAPPTVPAEPVAGGGGGGGVPSLPTGKGPKTLPTGGGARPTVELNVAPEGEAKPSVLDQALEQATGKPAPKQLVKPTGEPAETPQEKAWREQMEKGRTPRPLPSTGDEIADLERKISLYEQALKNHDAATQNLKGEPARRAADTRSTILGNLEASKGRLAMLRERAARAGEAPPTPPVEAPKAPEPAAAAEPTPVAPEPAKPKQLVPPGAAGVVTGAAPSPEDAAKPLTNPRLENLAQSAAEVSKSSDPSARAQIDDHIKRLKPDEKDAVRARIKHLVQQGRAPAPPTAEAVEQQRGAETGVEIPAQARKTEPVETPVWTPKVEPPKPEGETAEEQFARIQQERTLVEGYRKHSDKSLAQMRKAIVEHPGGGGESQLKAIDQVVGERVEEQKARMKQQAAEEKPAEVAPVEAEPKPQQALHEQLAAIARTIAKEQNGATVGDVRVAAEKAGIKLPTSKGELDGLLALTMKTAGLERTEERRASKVLGNHGNPRAVYNFPKPTSTEAEPPAVAPPKQLEKPAEPEKAEPWEPREVHGVTQYPYPEGEGAASVHPSARQKGEWIVETPGFKPTIHPNEQSAKDYAAGVQRKHWPEAKKTVVERRGPGESKGITEWALWHQPASGPHPERWGAIYEARDGTRGGNWYNTEAAARERLDKVAPKGFQARGAPIKPGKSKTPEVPHPQPRLQKPEPKEEPKAEEPSPAPQLKKPAKSVEKESKNPSIDTLARYFAPGRIVDGYSGKDRVISFQRTTASPGWSVTVERVVKQGDEWVVPPGEHRRTHTTQPSSRELMSFLTLPSEATEATGERGEPTGRSGQELRGGTPQVAPRKPAGSLPPNVGEGATGEALPAGGGDRDEDVSGPAGTGARPGERGEERVGEGEHHGGRRHGGPRAGHAGGRPSAGLGDREGHEGERLPVTPPAVTPETAAEPRAAEPAKKNFPTNFVITEDAELAAGGPKARIEKNLAAIKLARLLAAENRSATPDEQKVLAKYVGWGDTRLKKVFDEFSDTQNEYLAEREELKKILTPEEYRAASASVKNAHYTAPEVIRAIYAALNHLGVKPGVGPIAMIDPAAGIGHFAGLAPEGLDLRTMLVELDPTTASIAKALYPKADVQAIGFEEARLPESGFDLIVGNPPFGDYQVADPKYDKYKLFIHDYFFVKSLDHLRPGAIQAFVTAHGTMDKLNASARKLMAERGQFLGAVRLPETAFKANAGTAVVTDVLFFRKPAPGETETAKGPDWIKTQKIAIPDGTATVNEYYVAHPENVLGTHSAKGSMYGPGQYTVLPKKGAKDGNGLQTAMVEALTASLPKDVYTPNSTGGTAGLTPADWIESNLAAPPGLREGWWTIDETTGQVMENKKGYLLPAEFAKNATEKVKKLIRLRESVVRLRAVQLSPESTDDDVKSSLAIANARYDDFVKLYGPINKEVVSEGVFKTGKRKGQPYRRVSRPNLDPFRGDLSYPNVMGLEHYDRATGEAKKADTLLRRQLRVPIDVTHVDTPTDAISPSLNKFGRLNIPYMAEIAGVSEADVEDAIRGKGAYEDPETHQWELAESYLSGNVKEKLARAKRAADQEPERYGPNVEALKPVIPKDLEPSQIYVRLGTPWVPDRDYSHFGSETFNGDVKVTYVPANGGAYIVIADEHAKQSAASLTEFGTDEAHGVPRILKDTLNLRSTEITHKAPDGTSYKDVEATLEAQAKQEALKRRFQEWVWEDGDRAMRLARIYNDTYNHSIKPEVSGKFLTVPGTAEYIRGIKFKWSWWQLDAIWRILTHGNTLLAHVVGAGKTFVMVAAGMEMRRIGLARKPLYVVPNHMLEQFAREFQQLYPSANILVATKRDFQRKRRREFTARMASQDWDAIIMTHKSFEAIPVSRERQEKYINEEIAKLVQEITEARANRTERQIVRELENAVAKLRVRIQRLLATERKDDLMSFEETGVDQLFVDEAHLFKNLNIVSRMRGQAKEGADRSFDMLLKTMVLDERSPGRGVVFATGTPISNSIAEAYTMQRYLQPAALRDANIVNFDQWAATFGESIVDSELAPDGSGYRQKERFSQFRNIPELITILRQVADVKNAEDIFPPDEPGKRSRRPVILPGEPKLLPVEKRQEQKERPKLLKPGDAATTKEETALEKANAEAPAPTMVLAPRSMALEAVVKWLISRAAAVKAKHVDPSEDNFLKITTEGRYAAMDLRLVSPFGFATPGGKVSMAADRIAALYKEHDAIRGTQLVFSDIGTPPSKKQAVTIEDEEGGDVPILATIEEDEDEGGDEKKPKMGVPGFNIYEELRGMLVERGIPDKEIAFIHEAKSNEDKQRIIDDVKAGKIRVLMGSTEKMGAGMNAQDRIVAQHDLDAPWRPSDVEQRMGRSIRQGNVLWDEGKIAGVQLFRYGTEQSFDAYMWQTLERKLRGFAPVLKGDSKQRSFEDLDSNALDYADMKAATSGNPLVKEKNEVDSAVARLTLVQRQHHDAQVRVRAEVASLARERRVIEEYLGGARKDAAKAAKVDVAGDNFRMTIGKTTYDSRDEALAAMRAYITERLKRHVPTDHQEAMGKFGEFTILFRQDGHDWIQDPGKRTHTAHNTFKVSLDGQNQFYSTEGFRLDNLEEFHLVAAMEARYRTLADAEHAFSVVRGYEKQLAENVARADDFSKQIGKTFDKDAELETLRARQRELDTILKATEKEDEEVPLAEEGSREWWKMLEQGTWPYRPKTQEEIESGIINLPPKSTELKALPAETEETKRTKAMTGLGEVKPRRLLNRGAYDVEGTRWVTDGRLLIDKDALGTLTAKQQAKLDSFSKLAPVGTSTGLRADTTEKLFNEAVAKAENEPAEFLGVVAQKVSEKVDQIAYLRGAGGQLVTVDADYLATAQRITGADRARVQSDPQKAVVLMKGDTPVAIVMPIRAYDVEQKIDVELARTRAKERPGGPTQLYGFFDPFTAAAAMLYRTAPVQATIGRAAAHLAQAKREVLEIFNASAVTAEAGQISRVIRQHRAEYDLDIERARHALDQFRPMLEKLSEADRWAWVDAIEMDLIAKIADPDLRAAALLVRDVLDQARDEVQNLGTGKLGMFYEAYFPHIWKDPAAAVGIVQRMLGKRPMEGSKSFLKRRTIMTIADGLAAGLEPVSNNPLDLVILKHREMRRYIMAHRIFQEGRGITGDPKLTKKARKKAAVIKFKKASRPIPPGWAKINDKIATVFAPRGPTGETRIRGEYIAPVDVARVINNFLSPGLRGKWWYDAYAGVGNTLNMVQLGMSAFHAGFVAFDAMAQLTQIGLDEFLRGLTGGGGATVGQRVKLLERGAGKLALGVASAATGPLTVLPLPAALLQYWRGRQVWDAYFTDAATKQMQEVIEGLVAGGGRARMDDYYRAGNVAKMVQAFRDPRWATKATGVLRLPFAVFEASMYPLLEHVVPRMKLGAIFYAMQNELAKLGPTATLDETRKAAARVVDAVDARLGQMIYDNLFWHRVTKEMLMAGIRSVGWNVGTMDVTLGAGAQLGGNIRRMLIGPPRGGGGKGGGKGGGGGAGGAGGAGGVPSGPDEPMQWHKVQYLAVLAGLVALYGAIYTYLRTGERPKDYKDLYFPRTGETDAEGNPERIQPATYMKDVFSLYEHPITTVGHKLHPMLSTASEILQNKTFYGDDIWNRDAPGLTQARQVMRYVVKDALTPFAVRNVQELTKRGEKGITREKVEGFFGNQTAPRRIVRTEAQNKIVEILGRRGHPVHTPEEAESASERRDLRTELRQKTVSPDSIRKLARAGELTIDQAKRMLRDVALERSMARRLGSETGAAWISRFRQLTPEEAELVWDLATPDEQRAWAPFYKGKHGKADAMRRLKRPAGI